jgi:hypothetical protein
MFIRVDLHSRGRESFSITIKASDPKRRNMVRLKALNPAAEPVAVTKRFNRPVIAL